MDSSYQQYGEVGGRTLTCTWVVYTNTYIHTNSNTHIRIHTIATWYEPTSHNGKNLYTVQLALIYLFRCTLRCNSVSHWHQIRWEKPTLKTVSVRMSPLSPPPRSSGSSAAPVVPHKSPPLGNANFPHYARRTRCIPQNVKIPPVFPLTLFFFLISTSLIYLPTFTLHYTVVGIYYLALPPPSSIRQLIRSVCVTSIFPFSFPNR